MPQQPSRPISVFCATASSDAAGLSQWETHLTPLMQARYITVWSDQHLMAGTGRLQQMNDHMEEAQVIVFLLSPDFFVSDECMALMEQAVKGEARIIPLLLRPVDWKTSKLADLACLPANGQFVTTWDNLDDAFHTCLNDLRQLIGLPAALPQTQKPTPASALQKQNRVRMLRRLRRSYSDLMNQSLQGAAWLELGITSKPDAVQNAANLLLRVESRPERHLPPGTSILQAYDEVEHELLILGEPGAGKSTLLLDLAEQLVVRAEQDETHPLPVILPLSSWAIKRGSLEDWIAEQMAEIYDVPRKLSVRWVQEGRILPLLDGLDEMGETARPACVERINTYHCEHLSPLVVCSRTSEYESAASHHRLALQGAVMVQPLTYADVDASLVQAGKALAALRSALKKNEALRELATRPLMLNILTLTYQGTSVRGLSSKESLLLQQVWNDYIQRMVERKGNSKCYPLQSTRSWLGWLARQMREHDQTVFYLEHLQPDWLASVTRCCYVRLAVRLLASLVGVCASISIAFIFDTLDDPFSFISALGLLQSGVLGGLLGWLFSGSALARESLPLSVRGSHRQGWMRLLGIIVGFICAWSFGLHYKAIQLWLPEGNIFLIVIWLGCLLPNWLLLAHTSPHVALSQTTETVQRRKKFVHLLQTVHGKWAWRVIAIMGVGYGLSYELYFGPPYSLGYVLSYGINNWLSLGIVSVMISLALQVQGEGVVLVERLRWTWKSLMKSLLMGKHIRTASLLVLVIAVAGGLSSWLGNWMDDWLLGKWPYYLPTYSLQYWLEIGLNWGLTFGLRAGLSLGLSYWLLLGLFQGIAGEQIEDSSRQIPNQGIRRSWRNSLLMALISVGIIIGIETLSIGLSNWLGNAFRIKLTLGQQMVWSLGLDTELRLALRSGWFLGGCGGLLMWSFSGGLAVLRHYIIRLLLARSHTFPWKAPQFLDDSCARFLLRRVGGGYSFSHRLLLDHLADAETGALSSPNVSSTQFPHP